VIATPDLTSLRNSKSIIDLVRQNRPNDEPPKLVLNLMGQPKRPEIAAKDFANTVGVEPSVLLPYDPALYGAAANNAQMLMQVKANSPTTEGINRLAELITGRRPQESPKSVLPFLGMLKGLKQA